MDEAEQDQYEARLKELFDSFDSTGTGSLGQEELTDLCHVLHLEEVAPALEQTLLQGNLLGRVRLGWGWGLWWGLESEAVLGSRSCAPALGLQGLRPVPPSTAYCCSWPGSSPQTSHRVLHALSQLLGWDIKAGLEPVIYGGLSCS